MPSLVCSAQSCVYNEAMYCCKGDILVGGEEAKSSGDTCCTSFKERTSAGAKNSMGSPSQTIYVDCDACNCVHNKERKCHAEKIDIMGASASKSEQTACATFREE